MGVEEIGSPIVMVHAKGGYSFHSHFYEKLESAAPFQVQEGPEEITSGRNIRT